MGSRDAGDIMEVRLAYQKLRCLPPMSKNALRSSHVSSRRDSTPRRETVMTARSGQAGEKSNGFFDSPRGGLNYRPGNSLTNHTCSEQVMQRNRLWGMPTRRGRNRRWSPQERQIQREKLTLLCTLSHHVIRIRGAPA